MPAERSASSSNVGKYTSRFAVRMRASGGAADVSLMRVARQAFAIQNIVTYADIGCTIDHHQYATKHPNSFVPTGFGSYANARFVSIEPTGIMIFNTGRVVVNGSKSLPQSISAIQRVRRELRAMGITKNKIVDFEVANVVYVGEIANGNIDEERIHKISPENTEYSPPKFPGVKIFVGGALVRMFKDRFVSMGSTLQRCRRLAFSRIVKLCREAETSQTNKRS